MTTRTLALDSALEKHLTNAGLKGYASPTTLARKHAGLMGPLHRDGFDRFYEVHQIPSGPHAGRWVGLLVLRVGQEVTPEIVSYAHAGLPIYQHRAA